VIGADLTTVEAEAPQAVRSSPAPALA